MKFKFLTVLAVIAIGVSSCQQGGSEQGTDSTSENSGSATGEAKVYSVDLSASNIDWKGTMLGIYSHTGTINLSDASISVAGGMVTSGSFSVDMTSMLTTDEDALYKMASREKFIGHLQSDDFFGAETHPTSTFVFKSMQGNTITGDLSIKGETHEEKITDVVVSQAGNTLAASGKLVFDRQKYNVSWASPMSDRVLSDDIELDIKLTGMAQ